MPRVLLTDRQRQAVETVGRSLIVSAAAGSGKTSVLAERSAYLVCDAPAEVRCDVDQLLVLTFTDAAAAEMRGRIIDAIRTRRAERPGDARLREQLALVDAARISTIHSFCLWVIRRWFNEAGVDPSAPLLDEHEAALLRREVLDETLRERYARGDATDSIADCGLRIADWEGEAPAEPTGSPVTHRREPDRGAAALPSNPQSEGSAGASPSRNPQSTDDGFLHLVDVYGLGDDREIARFVLRLALFVDSLPDPDAWLDAAVERVGPRGDETILATAGDVRVELEWQLEYLDAAAAEITTGPEPGHFYADRLGEYGEALRRWQEALRAVGPAAGSADRLAVFEGVRADMHAYELSKERRPNSPKGTPDDIKARIDAAGDIWSDVKKTLWSERLRRRFALFSVDEWRAGLASIAPHVATIAALVRAFRAAYAERKRRLGVLDFSDLERFALGVLREKDGSPSPAARTLQRRFAYVLVDEFQDVSPIQDAIIRLASREGDPSQKSNLFVVGDVKQSIYRFRLAEPGIFLRRLRDLGTQEEEEGTQRAQRRTEDAEARQRMTVDREKREGEGKEGEEATAAGRGRVVFLPDNFRSRREILEAVNILFRSLMTESLGGIAYDREAELSPGRKDASAVPPRPVELHLLEAQWGSEPDDEEENDEPTPAAALSLDHPAAWKGIEREAYLIGQRLRAILATERKPDEQPYSFRDAAILLRASNISADKVAGVLTRMGIPAYADAGGSLFAALEVRDVVAALRVLDNPRQDIPLAAVLRSGIFGERFSDDDLAAIRCHDRDTSFHEAFMSCALGGSPGLVRESLLAPNAGMLVRESLLAPGADAALRERLARFLAAMNRHRDAFRRRPLADVLWRLYEKSGYLAYASGLPGGSQRRANLVKLHDLARQFGAFRVQGLHRFLRFIEGLEEQEQSIGRAPALGEAEDVVRITSIHRSKGLEYPIVFVAGLGTQFNLADRRGRMIFERETGIGLRVVDPERMIEYESCARPTAAGEVERQARAEELRILYVALTRARERLILVGSLRGAAMWDGPPGPSAEGGGPPGPSLPGRDARPTAAGSIPVLELATAATPLDWILPALAGAPRRQVARPGEAPAPEHRFAVELHEQAEMDDWRIERPIDPSRRELLDALAACAPLPKGEPVAPPDEPRLREVLDRISYVYPDLALASVRAAMSASEFKRTLDFTADPDVWDRPPGRSLVGGPPGPPAGSFAIPPSRYAANATDQPISAVDRGTITHRVLQHLDFRAAHDAGGVRSELDRLVAAAVLAERERGVVDEEAIAWFVGTPLAAAIRAAGDAYHREFPFVTLESASLFEEWSSGGGMDPRTRGPVELEHGHGPASTQARVTLDEHVLVRGVVDGILATADGLEIVDFKTDAVAEDDVLARVEFYRPQMTLYTRAMERLWQRPVKACRLVFLSARTIVDVECASVRVRE